MTCGSDFGTVDKTKNGSYNGFKAFNQIWIIREQRSLSV